LHAPQHILGANKVRLPTNRPNPQRLVAGQGIIYSNPAAQGGYFRPNTTYQHCMSQPKSKPSLESEGPVPKAVVNRLSLYLRELLRLMRDGHQTTSSSHLGSLLGFTDAQVRKDLAYFGHFGYPGIGYRCQELIDAIRRILGTDRIWPVAMVGVGNLGRALLGYKGFGHQNFRIVAAFDVDPSRVGDAIEGVPIHHLDKL
jgi:redox-sensing transcriptional repressor